MIRTSLNSIKTCIAGGRPAGHRKKNMNYKNKIIEIDRQRKKLAEERAELLIAWSEAEHPLKIGDTVGVNFSSYLGQKMIVENRWIDGTVSLYWWRASGHVIKKDGTHGKRVGFWVQRMED